jgi:hypothetical protein
VKSVSSASTLGPGDAGGARLEHVSGVYAAVSLAFPMVEKVDRVSYETS